MPSPKRGVEVRAAGAAATAPLRLATKMAPVKDSDETDTAVSAREHEARQTGHERVKAATDTKMAPQQTRAKSGSPEKKNDKKPDTTGDQK